MEDEMSCRKGHKNQAELYRWYLATDQAARVALSEDPELRELQLAGRALFAVRQQGWKLTATAEKSPADQAGIDWIWEHPSKGWFPIDCTAQGKLDKSRLVHLVFMENMETREGGGLTAGTKIDLAELLVGLTKSTPLLTRSLLAPPAVEPVRDSSAHLARFQAALFALKRHQYGELFLEWANELNKAVRYLAACQDSENDLGLDLIQSLITDGVRQYFALALANRPLPVTRQGFTRGFSLSWSAASDTLVLGRSESANVRGLSQMINCRFDSAYFAKVQRAGSATAALLQAKRGFAARGLEFVVHFLLDALEQKRLRQ
jgi:hypothetical protein